jgi:hypothetical protein
LTGFARDRRACLQRVVLAGLAVATLPWVACVPEPSDSPRQRARGAIVSGEGQGRAITRPVLLPWGEEGVWLVAPPHEQPVAYVSMGTRQLFVDFDYRDQVYWDLRAHISVSTGVWRIPLVGDPPKDPITPGDELREFDELRMREWDPTADPAEGDIRVMRGRILPTSVDFTCAPLAGGGAWYRTGPWSILQVAAPSEALTREDFRVVGTATRYADRDCTQPVGPTHVLTWSALEQFLPSEG